MGNYAYNLVKIAVLNAIVETSLVETTSAETTLVETTLEKSKEKPSNTVF